MNNIVVIGNLVANPELKYIPNSGKAVSTFTVAVKRDFAKEGMQDTDFIPVEVWGKTAENCANYLEKGRKVGVQGSIRIEKYTKDGETRTFTKILANNVEFLSSAKAKDEAKDEAKEEEIMPGFAKIDDEDIPF